MNTAILSLCLLVTQAPFPLGTEFNGGVGIPGEQYIKTKYKVVKRGNVYVYMYSIKNTGKKESFVRWTVLEQAIFMGSEFILKLKPGESVTITLEHKKPPFEIKGVVYFWQKLDAKRWQKSLSSEEEGIKVDFSGLKEFWGRSGGGMPGAIPLTDYWKSKQR